MIIEVLQNLAAWETKRNKIDMRYWMMGIFFAVIAATGILPAQTFAQEQPKQEPIMVGFLHNEAEQYQATWRLHTGYYPTLAKNGLQGALIDNRSLYSGTLKPGQFYDQIKPYHVIVLDESNEGVYHITAQDRERIQIIGADLERYVNEGGGLFLLTEAVRYPGSQDENFYNLLMKPFGVQMLHEGIFDKQHTFESPQTLVFPPMKFFWTGNIAQHPVTQGIRGLALPLSGSEVTKPGVEALGLDANWQTVVAGEPTAKSYFVGSDNNFDLDKEGSQKTAPPIAAVRSLGKGRIFIYSIPNKHAFLNYDNQFWPQITESIGDPAKSWPSGSNKLLINALRWLGQSALQNPALGTHKLMPIEPIKYATSVDWDKSTFTKPNAGVRGIIGAHSNYTDGKGSVADYVRAAKAAGLSYIVFTDPLELLTEEKFEKLKADCAAASTNDFYACPGVEFTDSLGVRWATWGESVVWPEASFVDKGKSFPVWNGKIMYCTGRYEMMCGYAPNAIVDYSTLHKANAHPANLWWFYRIFPFSYDLTGDKVHEVADNVGEYLYALRDLRFVSVDPFTRLNSPSQIAMAAKTCIGNISDLQTAHSFLNSRTNIALSSAAANQYVTQGPQILQWSCINNQMENPWQITRGAQRVPLRFEVASDVGIAQVIVHDANYGIVRRYDGHGAKILAREFEMTQDKQHYLTLEVVDTNGKRAISAYQFIYCYKSGLYRCGDNLNTLGSAQLVWHPDRNQMPSLDKYFENGFKYTVQGIDSGPAIAVQPSLFAGESISTTEGSYPPDDEIVNKILNVQLGSSNLQIYATDMTQRSEKFDTDKRPTPAQGPIARRLGPLPYFERHQITYAPASRANYFTIWNHRRPFEGAEDYRGDIMLTKGEIHFTKDVTLNGAVPLPLLYTQGPGGAKFQTYDHFYVTDREKGLIDVKLSADQQKPLHQKGSIAAGGYCATLNTNLGYYVFYSLPGNDFTYTTDASNDNPSLVGRTAIGLGHDGQKVKAGTVWHYEFALATVADPQSTDDALIKNISQGFNLDGKQNGYSHQVQTGKFVSDEYFFTAQAQNNEAQFSLGPRQEMIDLPIRVSGLEDNGCAAVYVKDRGFFRFVSVVGDTAYFQEPIDKGTQMWVGNPFVCDNKNVKITIVVDGQTPGKAPLLEVHNPTAKTLTTRIYSPPNTPLFGGMSQTVQLPKGDSVFYRIENKKLLALFSS